jgi:hypothetical protein
MDRDFKGALSMGVDLILWTGCSLGDSFQAYWESTSTRPAERGLIDWES